jgi:hypothetical protein
MSILERGKKEEDLILPTLKALRGIPVHAGAERILGLVSSEHSREVRIAAISVLGSCERSDILNKLSDFASMTEPECGVRKAVIQALTLSRCVALVRPLVRELAVPRDDVEEQLDAGRARVHMLAAGPAASGVAEGQLVLAKRAGCADLKH